MKIKFDFSSLKFRLWAYFILFALVLLMMLWLLQVFFLNNYYKGMKTSETNRVASTIEMQYSQGSFEDLKNVVTNISQKNDMTIQIESEDGIPLISPYGQLEDNDDLSSNSAISSIYNSEIQDMKDALLESGQNSVSFTTNDINKNRDVLNYASYLNDGNKNNAYLFISSPLSPVESTVDILANQLIYVTIISLIVVSLLSFALSRRITKPLVNITEAAEDLAAGHYGTLFESSPYTEISKLADTLTYTSIELAKSEHMQKDLIANVSHDLRTPLTMVTSYAEMIRDLSGDDPEKRNEHVQVIIDEAERLNQLVSDLLEVSKMQSGKESMNFINFSLKETIETILQSYTAFAEQEGYKLIFISQGEGVIRADETRIQQVITNLVSNAFKYSGVDKTIEVKMLEEDDIIRCEVSDHGIGIPKKDLKHIWERYYKASSNRKRSENTGLGLSIVKEILLLHNAKFGVQSALKKGSTFWFELKKPENPENNYYEPKINGEELKKMIEAEDTEHENKGPESNE